LSPRGADLVACPVCLQGVDWGGGWLDDLGTRRHPCACGRLEYVKEVAGQAGVLVAWYIWTFCTRPQSEESHQDNLLTVLSNDRSTDVPTAGEVEVWPRGLTSSRRPNRSDRWLERTWLHLEEARREWAARGVLES
jgi:hypothetical protein